MIMRKVCVQPELQGKFLCVLVESYGLLGRVSLCRNAEALSHGIFLHLHLHQEPWSEFLDSLLISDHLYLTLPSFYYLHNLKSYKVNTFLTLTFNRIPTSHGSSIRIRVRREDFQFEAGNYSLQPSITNHLYVYRHIWWTDWEEISRLSATHEESFTFEIFLKIFRLLLPLGASNAASQKQFILEKIFFM